MAYKVGKRGVTVCSQPPEGWLHGFAERWLPATTRLCQGESLRRPSPSAEGELWCPWHLVMTTFGTHVDKDVTVVRATAESSEVLLYIYCAVNFFLQIPQKCIGGFLLQLCSNRISANVGGSRVPHIYLYVC